MNNDKKENKLRQGAELNDKQLENVSGGTEPQVVITHPIAFKRCANDKTHVYPCLLDACPHCGCKKYTML